MADQQRCNTERAAAYLAMPVTTLVYWRAKHRGPRWYRLGKHVLYDVADLDAYVEEQKQAVSA